MDAERARIQEDLRGLMRGEARCDDVFREMYASDASVYQVKPLGVVRPRSAADVAACVQYAATEHIPIHARGAGSGLAGESLGPGLVIDFSSHLRRIAHVDAETVRVQPGVLYERLNAYLRPHGRHFGPDPANSLVTTMGSVVALDGSGSRWLKYGSARRHVRELEVVFADGSQMRLGREPLNAGVNRDPNPVKSSLVNEVSALLSREAELIERMRPKSAVNRCGYQLYDVLTPKYLDFPKLLAGSAGTLCLFTELTLDTQPLPRWRAMALLMFDTLDKAARAAPEIMPFGPVTCDLMDRRHLSLARETEPHYESLISPNAEALIVIEMDGDDPVDVRERLRQAVDRVQRRKRLAFDSRQTSGEFEMELFWRLARKVTSTLYRLKGATRALPFVEDIAVPPAVLPTFLVTMQNALKRHQITATLFAHAGHGQLHIRPFLDLTDPEHVRLMQRLADDLYDAVLEVGGTISGEHGDGFSRTNYVPRQYGELYRVFRELKRIFDPHNILNPGKVISEESDLITRHLRPLTLAAPTDLGTLTNSDAAPAPMALAQLELNWDRDSLLHMARSCNGCGNCRTQSNDTRMCPMFHFAPFEEAAPRSKANLLRAVLTGEMSADAVKQDDFKAVADLCINCQMCHLDCPAGVDISHLMFEAKAQHVASEGLGVQDWIFTRLDLLGGIGGVVAPLTNWLLANRQARWLMDKAFGLAAGRKLPRVASRTFMRRAARRRLTQPARRTDRKVAYFVDTYANYHDPMLAEALVAVLEHNGVSVFVPPNQTQSGMAMVSIGAAAAARGALRQNVPLLAEAVRQGYAIVTTEPSAALCLKREYPMLADDEDTQLVAENTTEACSYLWNLHQIGKLQLDFRPINAAVGYHLPCHLKALETGSPGESLLRLVPGLSVQRVEKGCSGMAGTWGLKRRNYRNSLRAGWPLISTMREASFQAGVTECSACKIQMEQGTIKPTIHPLKILALAYGLMPEVADLLTARGEELVVT